jgi:hypothetical protein
LHNAGPDTPRNKAILSLLQARGKAGATAPELIGAIHAATGIFVTAIATDVAAVRACGYPIEWIQFLHTGAGIIRGTYYLHDLDGRCHCMPPGEAKTMTGIYGDTIEAHYDRKGDATDYRYWLQGGKELRVNPDGLCCIPRVNEK